MDDVEEMIDFKADRYGHGCYLREHLKDMIAKEIPMECCPSSNVFTLKLENYKDLPNVKEYIMNKHNFSICTDNTLLFNTNISQEVYEIMLAFKLSIDDMKRI